MQPQTMAITADHRNKLIAVAGSAATLRAIAPSLDVITRRHVERALRHLSRAEDALQTSIVTEWCGCDVDPESGPTGRGNPSCTWCDGTGEVIVGDRVTETRVAWDAYVDACAVEVL